MSKMIWNPSRVFGSVLSPSPPFFPFFTPVFFWTGKMCKRNPFSIYSWIKDERKCPLFAALIMTNKNGRFFVPGLHILHLWRLYIPLQRSLLRSQLALKLRLTRELARTCAQEKGTHTTAAPDRAFPNCQSLKIRRSSSPIQFRICLSI